MGCGFQQAWAQVLSLLCALVSSFVKWNLIGMVERMRRDQVIYSMKPGTQRV